jgi:iron complex transport system ATP-binding protein
MQTTSTILQTQALSVGYASTGALLQNLQLEIRPGQLICLLGANGTGKSTLLRTLSGMQQALQGKVILQGKTLGTFSGRDLSQRMSIVLTERGIASHLRVKELLAMGRHPYTGWFGRLNRDDQDIIQRVMEDTAIIHFSDRPLYELSDGERQKVMIARAMVQDTPIIILDEPTVHLDLPNRVEIMQLLRRLAHQQQKAILMSSHDLDLVMQSADRLWLLQGKHIISGIPEDLVLQGKLEQTFQEKNIRFDSFKGSFSMRKSAQHLISFREEGLAGHWTRQALERSGFKVVQDASVSLSLSLQQSQSRPAWILQRTEETVLCHSLEAVLKVLKEQQWHLDKEMNKEG